MLALNKNKTKYTERWSNVPQVFIKAVDASDSVVADPGFQYFQECYNLEKLVLGFCDFFTDLAFDHLAAGRASITLKELVSFLLSSEEYQVFYFRRSCSIQICPMSRSTPFQS